MTCREIFDCRFLDRVEETIDKFQDDALTSQNLSGYPCEHYARSVYPCTYLSHESLNGCSNIFIFYCQTVLKLWRYNRISGVMGSAICTFQQDALSLAFKGKFEEQTTSSSAWLPVPSSKVPEPSPGACVEDTR